MHEFLNLNYMIHVCHTGFESATGRLESKSTCTCPGYNLTFECTVMADQLGGLTLWEGTALNCESTQNEIRLLHSRYSEGRAYSCNGGAVEGRGLRVEGHAYTSQLVVNVSTEMIGRGIQCVYDDGTITHLVGMATITPTTGMHMHDCTFPLSLMSISHSYIVYVPQCVLLLLSLYECELTLGTYMSKDYSSWSVCVVCLSLCPH